MKYEFSNFSPLRIGIDRRCDAGNSVTGEFLTHQPTSLNQNIFISIILTTKGHIFGWTFLNKLQRGFQISFCQHICCNVMLFQNIIFAKKKSFTLKLLHQNCKFTFTNVIWETSCVNEWRGKWRCYSCLHHFEFPFPLFIIINSPIVKFPEIENFFFITDQT